MNPAARAVVPTTWTRWVLVVVLCTMVLGPIPWIWDRFGEPGLPITVEDRGTYGEWEEGYKSFLIHSGDRTYHTSCPMVWISRLLITRNEPAVPIPAEPVDGPLLAQGSGLTARRAVATEPGTTAGNTARARVPNGVDPHDVLGVSFTVNVPTDQPCDSGYVGTYRLYEVSLPPVNDQPLPVDGVVIVP